MDEAEQYLIKKFDTMVPNGYNIKPGGNAAGMSEAMIAKVKATKSDPEWKRKFSIAVKNGHANSEVDRVELSKGLIAEWSMDKKKKKAQKYQETIAKKRRAKLEDASPTEVARLLSQWSRYDRWYQKGHATWSKGRSKV